MLDLANDMGIVINALSNEMTIKSATGQEIVCKITTLCLQFVRNGLQVSWMAEVAVALGGIRINHWGIKGFLEYFSADFDGPNRLVRLTAGDNLPATTPPG
jgi:hypothetical protein